MAWWQVCCDSRAVARWRLRLVVAHEVAALFRQLVCGCTVSQAAVGSIGAWQVAASITSYLQKSVHIRVYSASKPSIHSHSVLVALVNDE